MTSTNLRPPTLRPFDYVDRINLFSSPQATTGGPPLDRDYAITSSGRKAIALILEECSLKPTDEVLIVTTFNKPNVSSCVTSTVFNYCKPSRVLSDSTRAILVIHEFGVPHPHISELRSLCDERQIPLIEDCAHTVDSRWPDGRLVGSVGDYIIYSLPKIFAIPCGGLVFGLAHHPNADPEETRTIEPLVENLSTFWSGLSSSSARRKALLMLAIEKLGDRITVVAKGSENVTPWFLPVVVPTPATITRHLRAQKIECGLWHGSNIVVLPLHQYLTDAEMDFMVSHLLQATKSVG